MLISLNIWQSLFGVIKVPIIFDRSNKFGFFPGISLGYVISEEEFFSKNLYRCSITSKSWGSYGKVGDEGDFAAYQYLTGYTYPSGNYVLGSGGLTNGAKDKGMPNTNLTWYESTTANVGFEASVLIRFDKRGI